MASVRIDDDRRRALVAHLHRLGAAERTDDPVEVTRSVLALHATDPATVFLSVAARSDTATVADIEAAMYETRSIERVLGMRRTLFVVQPELRPMIQVACTDKIAVTENRRLVKMMAESGVGGTDPEAHLAAVKAAVLDALKSGGPSLGRELGEAVPELREKVTAGSGSSATEVGMTTVVLSRMAMDGTIMRGRPTGSWLSSQFTYEPATPGVGPAGEPAGVEMSVADASAELVERYLERFGPATLEDCQWWTGWTRTQTRKALEQAGAEQLDLDGGSGLVMPATLDLLDGLPAGGDGVAFLPALDPTAMGWKRRDWYLPEGHEVLFDRFGNVGPTIWAGGRVVGGWGQRPDGTVVYRLLTEVSSDAAALVDEEAVRIERWLDGTVVKPRFRAKLEKELAS